MEIDSRFPSKLDTVNDVPEVLRTALIEGLSSEEPIRLLIHAPAFSNAGEKDPATILAVTNKGWGVVSETEEGGASLEKADFTETLFLELTSILLFGELKIYFASVGTAYAAKIRFNTVGEELYQEAINLILAGTDPMLATPAGSDGRKTSSFKTWPIKFRREAERYWPKGQQLLAAIQWGSIFGGFKRELAPAGALIITPRELVLISEEKTSPRRLPGDPHEFGGIITFFPRVRLADFHVGHYERFGVLALQVHATHGGEKLEVVFPANDEMELLKAMEQVSTAADSKPN
ncbi:MAG: hypothetical protein JO170_32685 [Verrucomicrobia bacterium]|nr:hypothetical protein [Verrucomicrobiota bacterium]